MNCNNVVHGIESRKGNAALDVVQVTFTESLLIVSIAKKSMKQFQTNKYSR